MRTLWEFFSGGGMARLGLGPSWTCQFANDRDAAKARAYIANFGADHFNGADVASLTLADLPPGRPDLVWASPPCKDVSAAGPRIGLNGKRSAAFWPWWSLMRQLIDAGRGPRVIVIENVDTLLTSNKGADIASIRNPVSASSSSRRPRVRRSPIRRPCRDAILRLPI